MKAVLLCLRNNQHRPFASRQAIEALANRLRPDNISGVAPHIIEMPGILSGIFNPIGPLQTKHGAFCLGHLICPSDDWWQPGAALPDGAYALFRVDEGQLELVSDIVASRTIWYAQTPEVFIASTSQRAIIFFLQSFQANPAVFPWMLSSGTLGPGLSWDSRIQCLSGNSRLLLDRQTWQINLQQGEANFEPADLSTTEHKKRLVEVLAHTFLHLPVDSSKWILPLSGGFDSRAILLMMRDRRNLRCVTWGLKSSLSEEDNDAHVARLLAQHFQLDHHYLETDLSDEPAGKIFNRFLTAGEGRVDGIAAYLDGFQVWKYLFEQNIDGIMRGDEGFGWQPASSSYHVRQSVGARLLSDYANIETAEALGLETQTWPEPLQQRENETLATWRDRLYHEFRIPVVLSALSDLKLAYVNLITPFLSRKIIELSRTLPDALRTDKALFKEIVRDLSPAIGFAKHEAIAARKGALRAPAVVNLFEAELQTTHARSLLSDKLINSILASLKVADTSSSLKRKRSSPTPLKSMVARMMPANLKGQLRQSVLKPHVDSNDLAFRAYLISKTTQMLSADASALKHLT
jgi:hypothetical protein